MNSIARWRKLFNLPKPCKYNWHRQKGMRQITINGMKFIVHSRWMRDEYDDNEFEAYYAVQVADEKIRSVYVGNVEMNVKHWEGYGNGLKLKPTSRDVYIDIEGYVLIRLSGNRYFGDSDIEYINENILSWNEMRKILRHIVPKLRNIDALRKQFEEQYRALGFDGIDYDHRTETQIDVTADKVQVLKQIKHPLRKDEKIKHSVAEDKKEEIVDNEQKQENEMQICPIVIPACIPIRNANEFRQMCEELQQIWQDMYKFLKNMNSEKK